MCPARVRRPGPLPALLLERVASQLGFAKLGGKATSRDGGRLKRRGLAVALALADSS